MFQKTTNDIGQVYPGKLPQLLEEMIEIDCTASQLPGYNSTKISSIYISHGKRSRYKRLQKLIRETRNQLRKCSVNIFNFQKYLYKE